jgi:hypothetical protein
MGFSRTRSFGIQLRIPVKIHHMFGTGGKEDGASNVIAYAKSSSVLVWRLTQETCEVIQLSRPYDHMSEHTGTKHSLTAKQTTLTGGRRGAMGHLDESFQEEERASPAGRRRVFELV